MKSRKHLITLLILLFNMLIVKLNNLEGWRFILHPLFFGLLCLIYY
nr:MAG TPA: hypothetical protein [Caudoviricetes sp.]